MGRRPIPGRAGHLDHSIGVGVVVEPVAGLELQPAAARMFKVVAGLKSVRSSSSLLTVRGLGRTALGVPPRAPCRGNVAARKRAEAIPIDGDDRSLYEPSIVLTVRYSAGVCGGAGGGFPS